MTGDLCRCEWPALHVDGIDHVVRCSACGSVSRMELGLARPDLDRVRYRARINHLLEKAADIERQAAQATAIDRQAAKRYRTARMLQMHADGATYPEIAAKLGVCRSTVMYHLNPKYRASKIAASKRWNEQNPEKRQATQLATNEARRDRQRAYSRAWTRANPSRKRINNLRHDRRARAALSNAQ